MASPVPPVRIALFAGIGLFVLLAPSYGQVFGQRAYIDYLRPWNMFHGYGAHICEVKYFDAKDGMRPLDRTVALPKTPKRITSRSGSRVDSPEEVNDVASRLCKMHGNRADIRVEARCQLPDRGWASTHTPDVNACTGARSPSGAGGTSGTSESSGTSDDGN